MAVRNVGIVSDVSLAAAVAFPQIELDPVGILITVTEFGISLNAAPDSTVVPVSWRLYRNTLIATGGSAGTENQLMSNGAAALVTTSIIGATGIGGGTISDMHRFQVPNVSGMIWVAAPGREVDCIPAEFIGLQNEATLGTGLQSSTYMVWEE